MDAYLQGYIAYTKEDDDTVNPYSPGTSDYVLWLQGYTEAVTPTIEESELPEKWKD